VATPSCETIDADVDILKQIMRIRNAIAHSGDHAYREFLDKVIGNKHLLPGEKTPAGFLRSQLSAAPPVRRFQMYSGALLSAATRIAS
jgi:hypothetical protein